MQRISLCISRATLVAVYFIATCASSFLPGQSAAAGAVAAKPAASPGNAKPAAKTPVKKPAAPAKAPNITLPEAHAKQPYQAGISNITLSAPYKCSADNPPTWLSFDCPTLMFSGTPTETANVTYDITLSFTGADGTKSTRDVLLPVAAVPEVVDAKTGKYPAFPVAVLPAASKASSPKVTLKLTSAVAEGTTAISGIVQGVTASALPSIEVRLTPDGQMSRLAQLKAASGSSTTTSIAVSTDGTFNLTMANPLAAGQEIAIVLVPPAGTSFDGSSKNELDAKIPNWIQRPAVYYIDPPAPGSTITGWVAPMPVPAVAAIADASPAFPGNYPRVAVRINDPAGVRWATLVVGGANANVQTVAANGIFSLQLKDPLLAGQHIEVVPVPPPGHTFSPGPPPAITFQPAAGVAALEEPSPLDGRDAMPVEVGSTNPANSPAPSLEQISPRVVLPVSSVPSRSAAAFPAEASAASLGETVGYATLPITSGSVRSSASQFAGPTNAELPDADPVVVAQAPVLGQPTMTANLVDGTTAITGTATGSLASGTNVYIGVLRVERQELNQCLTIDNVGAINSFGRLLSLSAGSGPATLYVPTSNAPAAPAPNVVPFNLTLIEGLKTDDRIQIVQFLPPNVVPQPSPATCASPVAHVKGWHRTNLYFAAGVLLSNTSSSSQANANFSQANTFLGLDLARTWRLPATKCVNGNEWQRSGAPSCPGSMNGWRTRRFPGINTSFDVRLTAIPVSTNTAKQTSSGNSGTSTGAAAFLTTQRTVRVGTAVYAPWLFHISPGYQPGAIFFGPIAKAGFDTLTGAANNTQVIQGNTVTTLNYQSAYNNYSWGGRVGHMRFSSSENHAPEVDDYLDVTVGHFSNLESFICHTTAHVDPPAPAMPTPPAAPPGSSCLTDYPSVYMPNSSTKLDALDSRKQLFRLDIEGLVRIPVPATQLPFYLGFNANIGQHALGASHLDHGFPTPDDIRIFFGVKFDIGQFLGKLNLGSVTQ